MFVNVDFINKRRFCKSKSEKTIYTEVQVGHLLS